jgi:hypothetical protein
MSNDKIEAKPVKREAAIAEISRRKKMFQRIFAVLAFVTALATSVSAFVALFKE